MKFFTRFSLLVAIATAIPPAAAQSSSSCDTVCLAIFDPVCASNGETFGNECEFNRTKCTSADDTLQIVTKGECVSGDGSSNQDCQKEIMCLDVFLPVCGSDGKTYGNQCELRRAQCTDPTIALAYSGMCKSGGGSSSIGTDTDEAGVASCDDIVCTLELRPVCGSDDVTYGNQCLLQKAQCFNASITLEHKGECENGSEKASNGADGGPHHRNNACT